MAQSIYPSTINITGQYGNQGNYQFEFSLGESASIVTQSSSTLVVTSGVLQSFTSFASAYNAFPTFLPDEIKIYPNPFKDVLEINFLQTNSGKLKVELFDMQGKKMKELLFFHFGVGRTERWDLSKFPQGSYIVSINQLDGTGKLVIKRGVFKVLKIK
ncbi:T9SS type A sorting domain-containing protein [Sediminibacterium sp.]|uniref:T9SS type A sorting domain-containing protein n=1 Tax=Sediminibacterium sp. TaxID=1917865 RepID=UPI002733A433|nr:T9SS type A sorting domain-containing protein [Sediminibacterium sp.]MDP3394025.1 T9SS type A sorting domain-containing protein [Sediminibacterium sp.]MDP3566800.1 T9SS type A sorting domain-containing protein [Sediminibacterium sp.]